MPVRFLKPTSPAYAMELGAQRLKGVGFEKGAELVTGLPLAINATWDSDPIVVVGYNTFMLELQIAGGAGPTQSAYCNHFDPEDGATLVVSRLLGGGLGLGIHILVFGASFGGAIVGDVFHTIGLRLVPTAAGQNLNYLRLWGSAY